VIGGLYRHKIENMPAKIRLRRMGRKKKAHYRVVVADSAAPRDGRFVETIGYYKPLSQPARLVLNLGRVDHWLSLGAQPSGTMKSLISKARMGGDSKVALGEVGAEERDLKRAEALASRRVAETKAAADEAAAAKAAEEAASAAAEAEVAAEEPAAEAEVAAEEPAAEAEVAAEEPAAEAEVAAEAPAAEAEVAAEAPVAEAEVAAEAPVAEAESEPAAEAGADAEAQEAEEEKSE